MRDFWQDEAACKGMDADIFYPEATNGNDQVYLEAVENARSICEVCPVRAECLKAAVDSREQYGIWGGKTVRERRLIRRKAQEGARAHFNTKHHPHGGEDEGTQS